MPTYSQAKKIIWDSTTSEGIRILDYFPEQLVLQKNQQEMKIRLMNGSLFQLVGSNNIDSVMGTNPKIVVFSEYALQTTDAWDFIRPILKVNGGTAVFISTPRGRNHFFDLCQMAKTQPDWFYELLTYEDTDVLTKEDIEKEMIEGMSEELALQEYSCSFDRGVDGAFYAKLITKMHTEERITPLSYDPYKLVHTSWDLGWDECTSILFFQIDGDKIKIIDCEEHSNRTLEWYKGLLMDKGYKYGTHLFPHDVEHVDGLSTGLTRHEILEDLQIPVTVVKRSFIVDGIEATKVLLSSRIIINSTKCAKLLKALENYHREWDDKRKVYAGKPAHDWSSHFCFIGDTEIKTSLGDKKIEEVNIGDMVLTPFGYRRVLVVHKREVFDICHVKIDRKTLFSCTPEHDIFTQKGIVKCDSLRYSTLEYYSKWKALIWKMFGYFYKEQDIKGFKKIILSQKGKQASFLTDFFIDGMDGIIEEPLQHTINHLHCIGQFGYIIKERYQKIFTFITSMVIQKTIRSKISLLLRSVNIKNTIQICPTVGLNQINAKMYSENTQKKQRNGIGLKKVENGINNMQKTVFQQLEEQDILKNAKPVQKSTAQNRYGNGSVQTDVKQKTVLNLKSIMKKGIVLFVKKVLRLTNMLSKQHVVTNVELQKCDTRVMVYDLTIEEDGCYYANGYLVSNCDSLRYLAEGLRQIHNANVSADKDIDILANYLSY